jgi:hypothetical protein
MSRSKELAKYAAKVVLRNPNLNIVPDTEQFPWFIKEFQHHLQSSEARKELLLPNIQDENETIAVFSDYGGEHSSSKYYTYSFLVVAYNQLYLFNKKMNELRAEYGLNDPFKEIAFKRLDHGPSFRFLEPYLLAAQNLINGLVLTVVVEKEIDSLFIDGKLNSSKVLQEALAKIGMSYLKPAVAEKLFRVTHYLSFLITLLSKEGQKVFWMTDNDAIAANTERFKDALSYFSRVLGHYSQKKYALVGGAVPFEEKDSSFLDLLSIPDLVGGAVENYLTNKSRGGEGEFSVKPGSEVILKWLANQGISLKKHTMIIRKDCEGVSAATLSFNLVKPLSDSEVVSVFL